MCTLHYAGYCEGVKYKYFPWLGDSFSELESEDLLSWNSNKVSIRNVARRMKPSLCDTLNSVHPTHRWYFQSFCWVVEYEESWPAFEKRGCKKYLLSFILIFLFSSRAEGRKKKKRNGRRKIGDGQAILNNDKVNF